MNKTILLALIFIKASHLLFSQKIVKENIPMPARGQVVLNLKFADSIKVNSWERNEVGIQVQVIINNNRLNDAFVLQHQLSDGVLKVKSDFNQELIENSVYNDNDCPGAKFITYNYKESSAKRTGICSQIAFDIFLPRNASMQIESISGNIIITGLEGNIAAKSISGFIDLSWPEKTGASLELKTISGVVYSDIDIQKQASSLKQVAGYKVLGNVKGGGISLKLESVSGDIFLRKQQTP